MVHNDDTHVGSHQLDHMTEKGGTGWKLRRINVESKMTICINNCNSHFLCHSQVKSDLECFVGEVQ